MTSAALQSESYRNVLDIVDKLRANGISNYIDLPQIIVCGDQSSGKSSVLEAISGMSFPTKDSTCTRFATELILRRDMENSVRVFISPGSDRSPAMRAHLDRVTFDTDGREPDMGKVVEKAKEAMGLTDTKGFSTDTLRVELCGPQQSHLTMVDLPGIFRAGNSAQTTGDAETVKQLVESYMRRPRSIILAVISAKNDLALQEVTELARKFDPHGLRTLGIITKPDSLDAGSHSEASYIRLAKNQDVKFQLGWHTLKNRDYRMRNATSQERDEAEEAFFASGFWTSLELKERGVKTLRPRLSDVLIEQILRQLPSLLRDVEAGIGDTRERLDRLGRPRADIRDQRRYLLNVSEQFSRLMRFAVDGTYNDPFFVNTRNTGGYERRLRAIVQNSLTDFSDHILANGQNTVVADHQGTEADAKGQVAWTDYVERVKALMRTSRGCELAGTFNPMIIGELFNEQCRPWETMAFRTRSTILDAVFQITRTVLNHVAADETANELYKVVVAGIDQLTQELDQKVEQLLASHCKGHPITYNHYLTDHVKKAQAQRRQRNTENMLRQHLQTSNLDDTKHKLTPRAVIKLLEHQGEADMDGYASELAVDYMQAYYNASTIPFLSGLQTPKVEEDDR